MKPSVSAAIDTYFSTEDTTQTSFNVSSTLAHVRRNIRKRAITLEPLEQRQLLTAGFDDMSPLEQEVTTALVATAENHQIHNQIEQQRLMSNAVLDAFFAEFERELHNTNPAITLDDWFDTAEGQQWLTNIAIEAKSTNLTLTGITHAIAQAQAERPQANETSAQTLIADFAIQKRMAERVLQTLPNLEETAELRTQIEALTIPYSRSKAHYIGGSSFTLDIESKTKNITVYMVTEAKYSAGPAQVRGVTATSLQREALSTSHTFSAWLPGSNQIRFVLVDTNNPSTKIDEFTIPFTGNVASSSNWPEFESGLLLEKPISPKLWIQEISGRNVTVVYQTPYNAGSIGIPGYTQGFETVTTKHVGGTLPKATVLTFTNLAPGVNTIYLYDTKGNVIATLPLNVTAKYDSAGRYAPVYSVQGAHTWNADTYAQELDAWLPHSKANGVKEMYTQELRREQAFVHTVDAKFYPLNWGTLYNRMYSAKAGNQYGVLTKWIGPRVHEIAPFHMSNLEYLQKQKATRPDLFTSTGAVQPGKWSAAAMFEQNTNQYYVQYLTKIEGFINMAAQVLADIANGEPMNSPVQTAYKQYYPMGFTDIRGGYHSQESMLRTVAAALYSEAGSTLLEEWKTESDRLHGVQDVKRQEAAEDALYRNERIMGDLIANGFMRTAVSNTEHAQNQARAAETFSSSQTSAKAKELATSRNYQRAQRLIAQRLQSSIPATGQYRVVANHTYNSPIIVEDTTTNTAVYTVYTEEVAQVAGVVANVTTTLDEVERVIDMFGASAEQRMAQEKFTKDGPNALRPTERMNLLRGWFADAIAKQKLVPGVRTDTLMAQVYHGMLYALEQVPNWYEREKIAEVFVQLTNTGGANSMNPVQRIVHVLRGGATLDAAFNRGVAETNLRQFFTEAQYNEVFNTPNAVPPAGTVVSAYANKDLRSLQQNSSQGDINQLTYKAGETIRVRFDVGENPETTLHHAMVYVTINGVQYGPLGKNDTYIAGKTYIEFSAKEISTLLRYSTMDTTAQVALKVVAWSTAKNKAEFITHGNANIRIQVEVPLLQDLSTNPDPSKREVENVILNEIAENFLVDNPGTYKWNLGSGHHDDANVYAVDLNSVDGGDKDRGNVVRVVSKGVMSLDSWGNDSSGVNKQLKTGAVIVKHNTNGKKWTSEYLHMPIFDTGQTRRVEVEINGQLTTVDRRIYTVSRQQTINQQVVDTGEFIEIWSDKPLKASDQIGYIGGRTVDGNTYHEGLNNAHMHFVGKDEFGKSIDLRKVISAAGITKIYAFDGGIDQNWATNDGIELKIEWDESVKSFVNYEHMLILDRSAQMNSSPSNQTSLYWLSWNVDSSQRERVVWNENSRQFKKLNNYNSNWIWNKDSRQFILI